MSVTAAPRPTRQIASSLLERWQRIPVAVTVDLSPALRQISSGIRPLRPAGQQPGLFGPAVTAACTPPDFGAVLHAVDACEAGDVLVIAADGFAENAMIGEVLCGHLCGKGVAGVVCDGAIRDAASLAAMDTLSVYYHSINPRGPTGAEHGAVNTLAMVGSVAVHPGDVVMGDDDGLIVLSPDELERWIDNAEARLATEQEWLRRLDMGENMQSLFDLDTTQPPKAE